MVRDYAFNLGVILARDDCYESDLGSVKRLVACLVHNVLRLFHGSQVGREC